MALSYERRHLSFAGFHQRPGGAENLVGVVRNIDTDMTEVPTVGAVPTALYTFTVPVNTLRVTDDFLDIEIGGFYANNANGKNFFFNFDGTGFIAMGLVSAGDVVPGRHSFKMLAKIVRLTATSVIVNASFISGSYSISAANAPNGGGFGGAGDSRNNPITVANLNSNAVDLVFAGIGIVNGDIVKNLAIVNVVQN